MRLATHTGTSGDDWAFLVLVSDGITDSMSDQEIVDLCRGFSDPTRAASNIVKFAEDVGGCASLSTLYSLHFH